MPSQPNRTRQALLGFLSWGPMSGYDLRRVIDQSISNFWTESYGRIYPMLAQLEEDGLVTKSPDPKAGARPRHVYRLTDAGREALAAWLDDPVVPRPARNELLLKLFFAARSEPAAAVRWVEAFRSEQLEARERYKEIRERLTAAKGAPPDLRFWLMTLEYGELEADAHLEWCERVLAELSPLGEEESEA